MRGNLPRDGARGLGRFEGCRASGFVDPLLRDLAMTSLLGKVAMGHLAFIEQDRRNARVFVERGVARSSLATPPKHGGEGKPSPKESRPRRHKKP